MIKTESIMIGNKEFIKTYSDSDFYIHGGNPEGDYSEAIDPADLNRTYTETNIPIEEEITVEEKAEAFDILMGEE